MVVTAATLVLGLAAPVTAANPHGSRSRQEQVGQPARRPRPEVRGPKAKARENVLKGKAKATGKNKVVKVAKGQYVQLAFEGEDKIFTLLGRVRRRPAPTPTRARPTAARPDRCTTRSRSPTARRRQHDDLDRRTSTRRYYQNLLYDKDPGPSMANWYLEQSSGRYSVDGYVSDWVQVPFNEAAYGSNYCGSIVCTRDVGRFVDDQADAWWTTR